MGYEGFYLQNINYGKAFEKKLSKLSITFIDLSSVCKAYHYGDHRKSERVCIYSKYHGYPKMDGQVWRRCKLSTKNRPELDCESGLVFALKYLTVYPPLHSSLPISRNF